MRLKKYLRSSGQKGQVTMEYFILLCVIAAITIVGGSSFFTRVARTTNGFLNEGVNAMEQPDINAYNSSLG